MIVATAGHIDHGKTTLVRALTGVDTDRLPEEKKRGISIDLGFAHWHPPEARATTISFVDVPGHEKFIGNMLAGVCAIDYVLLVVAADDGVMPQTVEHLNIVDLLGVERGIVAVTKADRVPSARVAEVVRDARQLLAGTRLASVAVVPVSATAGTGMRSLSAALTSAALTHVRSAAGGRRFRYAVDRVFTVAGAGTIVTGTVLNGRVAVNERLQLAPWGRELRVRSIQAYGRNVDTAAAGQRCALNLGGIERAQVRRGDWIVDPEFAQATSRTDVRIELLPGDHAALRDGAHVHFHFATQAMSARVGLRGSRTAAAGTTVEARLSLALPIVACNGDRFVLRDSSGQRTIGGGVIVDPEPPVQRLRADARAARFAALATLAPEPAFAKLLDATPAGVPLRSFARGFALDAGALSALVEQAGAMVLGRTGADSDDAAVAIATAEAIRVRAALRAHLAEFHRREPRSLGIPVEALRASCARGLALAAFTALLRRFAAEDGCEVVGELVRRVGHIATDNAEDLATWQRVRPRLAAAARRGLHLAELAEAAGLNVPALKDFLHRKSRTNEVFHVLPDRFFLHATMHEFAAIAADVAAHVPLGRFTAAQFRDAAGIGRGLAIEVLVKLDRLGVTQRAGDVRTLRKGPAALPSPFVSARVRGAAAALPAGAGLHKQGSREQGELECQQ